LKVLSKPLTMNPLRSRLHRIVDRLSDDELEELWTIATEFYYDSYMLRAIQEAKQTFKPGDTFKRDEALQLLLML